MLGHSLIDVFTLAYTFKLVVFQFKDLITFSVGHRDANGPWWILCGHVYGENFTVRTPTEHVLIHMQG